MDPRAQALENWLNQHCQLPPFQLHAMPADASFRRYFRVQLVNQSYVAMDAPPEREKCVHFIAVARALRKIGLNAPDIIASDLEQGFLLLTDFGDRVLLRELNQDNANELYGRALDALATFQKISHVDEWTLPCFTADFMRQELDLFKEWFLLKYLNLTLTPVTENMLQKSFHFLAESAAAQPYAFMYRDFHSGNLMVLPEKKIGLLDFQDAMIGPVTYDLVSLLRDCYIAWPETLVNQLVQQCFEKLSLPNVSLTEFTRWFDLMGLQRHLKALLTFSRKAVRDANSHYLQHIPRTLNYILKVSERYSETKSLHEFIANQVTICVA